ncbi:MAG: response regulator [Epsilonproteobacteria bacterium]|nr:response regulator [Campylobacterota bacterium]NPA63817.1 response regulator [Campylobacterota bacterium]
MKELNVLYVDDDMINRKLLENILNKSPFISKTYEAKDGMEALQILQENPDINFVLLDVLMPNLDGITTLQFMKNDKRLARIPVIVLSTDDTQKVRAIEAGANDFINKPVKKEELLEKIEKYSSVL